MVAFATRVPESEARRFEAMVKEKSMEATGTEEGVSAAAVIRGLMLDAVKAWEARPKPKKGGPR